MSDKSKSSNEPAKGIFYIRRAATLTAIIAVVLLLVGVSGQMSYKPGGLLLLVALALGVKKL